MSDEESLCVSDSIYIYKSKKNTLYIYDATAKHSIGEKHGVYQVLYSDTPTEFRGYILDRDIKDSGVNCIGHKNDMYRVHIARHSLPMTKDVAKKHHIRWSAGANTFLLFCKDRIFHKGTVLLAPTVTTLMQHIDTYANCKYDKASITIPVLMTVVEDFYRSPRYVLEYFIEMKGRLDKMPTQESITEDFKSMQTAIVEATGAAYYKCFVEYPSKSDDEINLVLSKMENILYPYRANTKLIMKRNGDVDELYDKIFRGRDSITHEELVDMGPVFTHGEISEMLWRMHRT